MLKHSPNQPATKKDLKDLGFCLDKKIDANNKNLQDLGLRLDKRIDESNKEIKNLRHALANEVTRLDFKIDTKIDELKQEMVIWKDELLTSNDKLAKKLDQVLIEQQATNANYRRLDYKNDTMESKVSNLESFAEAASKKLKLDFHKV